MKVSLVFTPSTFNLLQIRQRKQGAIYNYHDRVRGYLMKWNCVIFLVSRCPHFSMQHFPLIRRKNKECRPFIHLRPVWVVSLCVIFTQLCFHLSQRATKLRGKLHLMASSCLSLSLVQLGVNDIWHIFLNKFFWHLTWLLRHQWILVECFYHSFTNVFDYLLCKDFVRSCLIGTLLRTASFS